MARVLWTQLMLFFAALHLVAHVWSPPCSRVLEIDTCSGRIIIESDVTLAEGDSIVLHQAQGAEFTLGMEQPALHFAGMWSIHKVVAVQMPELYVSPPPAAYQPQHYVQVCPIITGSSVSIETTIVVQPWKNGAGGIIAIHADTIRLHAVIDATGAGFPGGLASMNTWDTSRTDNICGWFDGKSAGRGIGLAAQEPTQNAGRMPGLLGGGGGNARNAGGGGGAHAGTGGMGGCQTSEFGSDTIGGIGATALFGPTSQRLFFGGGGGGGHQNDFMGTDGGSGGGIVIIRARRIEWGADGSIRAAGENAHTAVSDGAGGGGAGGTVYLHADTIDLYDANHRYHIDVSGGRGGNVYSDLRQYGTGGGGGGGTFITVGPYSHYPLRVLLSGGINGMNHGIVRTASDSAYGATSGSAGQILSGTPRTADIPTPCELPVLRIAGINATASAGEIAMLPITIETHIPYPYPITLFMRVRTRATVLWPLGAYRWAGNRYTVQFREVTLPANFTGTDTVYVLARCLLGDSVQVGVTLDSVTINPANLNASIEHNGIFTLSDVCTNSKGIRLFNPLDTHPQSTYTEYSDPNTLFIDVQGRIGRISDLRSSAFGYHQIWYPIQPVLKWP